MLVGADKVDVMEEIFAIEAERGYVQVGPTRLSYLDWGGRGPALLLLHGITSSAAAMWRAAPALGELGFRVVALDMPGHGASELSAAHDIDTIAGLVGEAIEQLQLREVTLVGHSWGGATALALAGGAHTARKALSRVALIDPLLGLSTVVGERFLPSYLVGVGQPAAKLWPNLRTANPDWHAGDVYWKGFALEQCRAKQVAGLFVESGDWTLLEQVRRIELPLLILVADLQHTVIPPDALEELRRAMRPSLGQLLVVPGTNHNMLRGGFAPTMAALTEWLRQH